MNYSMKKSSILMAKVIKIKLYVENGKSPSSKFSIFSSKFSYRPIVGAHSEMSNHLIKQP